MRPATAFLTVVDVFLESEFGCVRDNDRNSRSLYISYPTAKVGHDAQAIDAEVGPEVDEHSLPFRPSAVSGGEFSQSTAPDNGGIVPSTGGCSIWFDVSAFVTECGRSSPPAHPNSAACTVASCAKPLRRRLSQRSLELS